MADRDLPLANAAWQTGERRYVSVLFADMVGYTATLESLGDEQGLPFVQMVYDRLVRCVRKFDGSVHAFGGDSIMAVFGVSGTTEDAALRACRAARLIHESFAAAADEIEARFGVRPSMRVGVSSGIAVVAPVDSDSAALTTIGNNVNLASRIQTLAPPGTTLLCEATRRLIEWQAAVEFHGEQVIKGLARPQKLWRLVSVHERAQRFDTSRGRGLSPLVGRDDQLATMRGAFERVSAGLTAIDLVGEPGIGKTRLIFEFMQSLKSGDYRVFQGHCTATGEHTPFLPFLDIVRSAFQIGIEDSRAAIVDKVEAGLSRLALDSLENRGILINLLGLPPPEGALAGLDGVLIGLRTRDLLSAMVHAQCRLCPLIIIVEDVHWIDSATEQVLGDLIRSGAPTNLLIIYTRRPEFVVPWQSERVTTVELRPLDADEVARIARSRATVEPLPAALIEQVAERAAGNPLFAEEILGFLVDSQATRREAGEMGPDAPGSDAILPASLLGLLTAKIDRLSPADRAVLQVAAVIGRRFDANLLSAAAGAEGEIAETLDRLRGQDLIRLDIDGYHHIFRHVMMRDCVYHQLLQHQRAQLHLAVAQAVERRSEGRITEAVETLAYHYALTDEKQTAFTYFALAGAKSLGIFSHEEANRYFALGLALYEGCRDCASDEQVARLLADYALCLNLSLCVTTMIPLFDRVQPILARLGDSREHALFLHHYVSCLVCNGRFLDALAVQKSLSAMAERLGDPMATAYALVSELSVSTYCAPLPLATFDAKRREVEALLDGESDAYLQNFFLASVGFDELCRGRVDRAHATSDRLIALGTATNDPRSLGYGTAMRALIASVSDDYEQALALADRAIEVSRARFEQAIAGAARCGALVLLRKPGAVAEVQRHIAMCAENGWGMFHAGPDLMLGIAEVMNGQIAVGLARLEATIARHEKQGFRASADWGRLFLCEVYLSILAREQASLRVLLRNLRPLAAVMLTGPRRVGALVEQVRGSAQWDPEGHYIGRAEMITGLLYKMKKDHGRARHHLHAARRIIGGSGASPLLSRVDAALESLAA